MQYLTVSAPTIMSSDYSSQVILKTSMLPMFAALLLKLYLLLYSNFEIVHTQTPTSTTQTQTYVHVHNEQICQGDPPAPV